MLTRQSTFIWWWKATALNFQETVLHISNVHLHIKINKDLNEIESCCPAYEYAWEVGKSRLHKFSKLKTSISVN